MFKEIETLRNKLKGQSDLLELEKKAIDDTKKSYENKI